MPLSLEKVPRNPVAPGVPLSLVKGGKDGQDDLPPPHPALVELVRLMARVDARRARADGRETR